MSIQSPALARLSDDDLLAAVDRLARGERHATAELIAHLAELDARRLYLGAGFASLFVYCISFLRLSEDAAYNRIEAAGSARRFPMILDLLGDGSLNLTSIRLLARHLTAENHAELLAAASGKRRRDVEELLASRFPSAPVPSSVRKLPEARSTVAPLLGAAPAPLPAVQTSPPQQPAARRAVVAPLAPEQYRITFTASAETLEKLREAQDLLRHQIPSGDPAEIFARALSALLADLARKKLAATQRPRPSRGTAPGSRHVPAEVRRGVWSRDAGAALSCRRVVAAVASRGSWSSTTGVRTPPVARPPSGTSPCAAVPTTNTRRRATSVRGRAARLVLERVGPAATGGVPTARHLERGPSKTTANATLASQSPPPIAT